MHRASISLESSTRITQSIDLRFDLILIKLSVFFAPSVFQRAMVQIRPSTHVIFNRFLKRGFHFFPAISLYRRDLGFLFPREEPGEWIRTRRGCGRLWKKNGQLSLRF